MREMLFSIVSLICRLFPIRRNKVFFLSYYGSNPKYLSEYLSKTCSEYDIVWGFVHPEQYLIDGIRKVKYHSIKYFYELATSHFFITNYRTTEDYKKRKGQIYIQTWHSSLRLKMIEKDAEQTLPVNYVEMAKSDSGKIDILLSGCDFSTQIFRRAFWYEGIILESGTPREDIFFGGGLSRFSSIKERIGVHEDKRIVLYAPTFRKDNSFDSYCIDYVRLCSALKKRFGGEWIVLLRLHPHLRTLSSQLVKRNCEIKDVSSYDDIQELLAISDVLISDYSSLVFDYLLTDRPCFLYVPDLTDYTNNDRELYFNIADLPFASCEDNDQLDNAILCFDENNYKKRITLFNKTIGSFEDGNACSRVAQCMKNYLP